MLQSVEQEGRWETTVVKQHDSSLHDAAHDVLSGIGIVSVWRNYPLGNELLSVELAKFTIDVGDVVICDEVLGFAIQVEYSY
jgi:hypothetical protein